MIPRRHLSEKENILLFPPALRLPILRESVWGKANESCLEVRCPFPNTALSDMFIFQPFKTKKQKKKTTGFCPTSCFAACACPAALVFSPLFWRTSSPIRWVFNKQVQVLKLGNIRFQFFFSPLAVPSFLIVTNISSYKPSGTINAFPTSLAMSALQEQMAESSGLWGTACLPECNGNLLCREMAFHLVKQCKVCASKCNMMLFDGKLQQPKPSETESVNPGCHFLGHNPWFTHIPKRLLQIPFLTWQNIKKNK